MTSGHGYDVGPNSITYEQNVILTLSATVFHVKAPLIEGASLCLKSIRMKDCGLYCPVIE